MTREPDDEQMPSPPPFRPSIIMIVAIAAGIAAGAWNLEHGHYRQAAFLAFYSMILIVFVGFEPRLAAVIWRLIWRHMKRHNQ